MTHSYYHDLLKSVARTKIVRAEYFIHISKDSETTVISVNIIFTDNRFMTIRCGSDGESLHIGQEVFETTDLGDAGTLKVVDSNDLDPASLRDCVGKIVNYVVVESYCSIPKTLRIKCNNQKVFLSNVGDTLNFDETLFRKIISEEGWPLLDTTVF